MDKQMADYLEDSLFETVEGQAFDFDKWALQMFYYNRNDLSEGVNPFDGNNSKECIVFHYWFLIMGLNFTILPVIAVITGQFCV